EAPAGCVVMIDGEPTVGPVLRPTGPHWARVACPDHAPWATRIDLTTLDSHVVASPKAYEPPAESEVLVQARVSGARAIVIVEVHGQVATARLVAIDGRERERRTIAVSGDLAPVASAIDDLLTPPNVVHRPWYQSRWVWAAGAAMLTAVIVVPVTAAIAGD